MGWPRGVPRKATLSPSAIPIGITPSAPHYDAIFGIRVHRNGPFKGLWELVKLKPDSSREVLTDANSRGMVITLITRAIMRIVVMMG